MDAHHSLLKDCVLFHEEKDDYDHDHDSSKPLQKLNPHLWRTVSLVSKIGHPKVKKPLECYHVPLEFKSTLLNAPRDQMQVDCDELRAKLGQAPPVKDLTLSEGIIKRSAVLGHLDFVSQFLANTRAGGDKQKPLLVLYTGPDVAINWLRELVKDLDLVMPIYVQCWNSAGYRHMLPGKGEICVGTRSRIEILNFRLQTRFASHLATVHSWMQAHGADHIDMYINEEKPRDKGRFDLSLMNYQRDIVTAFQPHASYLRFNTPGSASGLGYGPAPAPAPAQAQAQAQVDRNSDNKYYEYLAGEEHFLPFEPFRSTETRLYVTNPTETKRYDVETRDRQILLHEMYDRFRCYECPQTAANEHCSCLDCAAEVYICQNYLRACKSRSIASAGAGAGAGECDVTVSDVRTLSETLSKRTKSDPVHDSINGRYQDYWLR